MKQITIDFPGISLLDVRNKFPECFYTKKDGWYEEEAFAKEVPDKGKYTVQLEPVEDSFSKTWSEQEKLLGKNQIAPPIAVLVYAMCMHYKKTGERTFENCYVRTSSIDSGGDRVRVGYFDDGGLFVYYYWDNDRDDGLGVAAARKDTGTLESLEPFEGLSLEARVKKLEDIVENMRKFLVL